MTTPTSGCLPLAHGAQSSPVARYGRCRSARRARSSRRAGPPAAGSPSTVTCPILRPGPHRLAVQVDLHARVGRHHVQVAGRNAGIVPTEDIRHHDLRRDRPGAPSGRSSTARRCCSNCEVTAPSMVQCPLLCGRMASSLTSSPPGVSNSSTASSPVTSSSAASSQRQLLGLAGQAGGQPRRGRQHLVADPVSLHGLHDRVDGGLAVRGPGRQHGQLAVERRCTARRAAGPGGPAPRRPAPASRTPRRPCRRIRR